MSLTTVPRAHSQSCGSCSLHQSFCDLSPEIRDAFDGLKTTTAYRKNEVIFDEGARAHSVFAICEGTVKLVTTSTEGRTLMLRTAHPGEMLGLAEAVLGPTPYDCSAIAAESAILAVIPRETFMRFISSYPEACHGLTFALSEQYSLAQREAKFLAFGETSTARLTRLLLEWSAEQGKSQADGIHIPLHMTHTDFAQAIGSTRETVTRVLGHLVHDGLVERRSDEIIIRRPADLARLSSAPASDVTANRDGDAFDSEDGDRSIDRGGTS
jgi:CRP/FNR family transcriptional regulator